MAQLAGFLFLIAWNFVGASPACNLRSNSNFNFQNLTSFLQSSAQLATECAQIEVLNPLADPFRKQALALSICQKNPRCIDFLKEEAARVSERNKEDYTISNATFLWFEILIQSGRTRIQPPKLSDLPLNENIDELFKSIRAEVNAQKDLPKNQKLSTACMFAAAMLGPAKFKALGAAKTVSAATALHRIEQTHDVEKLLKNNRLPNQVKEKLLAWMEEVKTKGLEEVRKIPGYHDEPILSHSGWRSVRLNNGFRACYEIIVANGIQTLRLFSISNDHKNYCRK